MIKVNPLKGFQPRVSQESVLVAFRCEVISGYGGEGEGGFGVEQINILLS